MQKKVFDISVFKNNVVCLQMKNIEMNSNENITPMNKTA